MNIFQDLPADKKSVYVLLQKGGVIETSSLVIQSPSQLPSPWTASVSSAERNKRHVSQNVNKGYSHHQHYAHMNNCWPGTVEWSSQKTYNQSVPKARWSSAGQTHKGSKEIGTCQSSLPCQASTACLPAGKMEQNGEVVTLGRLETEKNPCVTRKYLKIFETASRYFIWTDLADAECGLDLLLGVDQCTLFTPQPVQCLKGSFGPLVAAFFQFWHKVVCRKVAFPGWPGVTDCNYHILQYNNVLFQRTQDKKLERHLQVMTFYLILDEQI